MKLSVKNLGLVSKAEIHLNGLTVITGNNETGKSTIGKALYTIIKGISSKEELAADSKASKVFNFFRHNLPYDLQRSAPEGFDHIIDELREFPRDFGTDSNTNTLKEFIESKKDLFAQIELNEDDFLRINKHFDQLLEDTTRLDTENYKANIAIKRLTRRVFQDQLSPNKKTKVSEVRLSSGNKTLIDYSISNDIEVKKYNQTAINNNIFNDVTFIETPLVLQMQNLAWDRYHNFVDYWSDLIRKLMPNDNQVDEIDMPQYCSEIYAIISEIINGNLIWNHRRRELVFKKTNIDMNLFVNNLASGAKYLSIIQQLAFNGKLSPDHLLILDEPENHLHPEWQVKFAKIIVILAKNGVPILLTTHSPFMLEAIKKFSIKNEIWDNKTKLYFAMPPNRLGNINIKDVSTLDSEGCENRIFDSFMQAYDLMDEMLDE